MEKKKNFTPLVALVVFMIAALVGGVYGFKQYQIYQEEYQGTESTIGEDVTVVIPEGASTKKIAQILHDKGLIEYPGAFVKRVKESEYKGNLQPGEFTLNTGMSTWDMIETMGNIPTEREVIATLTIPEGFSVEQIAARVNEQGIFTQEEFLNAVKADDYDYEFLDDIPEGIAVNYRLQGFLFPATYNIYSDTTPHDLVGMMLEKFNSVYTGEIESQAVAKEYTAFELITRASIVEREAKLDEERPIIAGVMNNRLAIDMPLQVCPSVLYPITNGLYDKGTVTNEDTQVVSPYNTYTNPGLPVGPICNPGEKSIRAVLNAESHSYLFYHVDNPETGSHIFTETYEEHLQTQ